MAAVLAALRRHTRRKKGDEEDQTQMPKASGPGSPTLKTPPALPVPTGAGYSKAKGKVASGDDQYMDLPYRKNVHAFYNSTPVQITVACVILINFFAIIVEKEIDPYPAEYQRYRSTWVALDDVCNYIFIIELLINIYGSFWRPFVKLGWNYLDLTVVVVGLTSIARVDLGPAGQIKILRAFRILRLFKRVESLNKILTALIKSIPGVLNAFVVMLIFMMIFAIVAVDFFSDFGADGDYTTVQTYGYAAAQWGQGAGLTPADGFVENTTTISAMTPRGFHYGQEYYGTFSRSLYTLFQVLTGESWSEAVVRPLLFGWDPRNAMLVGVFFTVYILLTQVVLQNVVVAVPLDKFVESDDDGDKDEPPANEEGTYHIAVNPNSTDAAIAHAATSSGVAVPTTPPRSPYGHMASSSAEASVTALLKDAEQIKADQALIKVGIQTILSRLPSHTDSDGLVA